MIAVPLAALLLAAAPARAGVAASAEAGAEGTVPRISLQTQLSPGVSSLGGASLTPGLVGVSPLLAAPSLGEVPKLPAAIVPTALQPVKPAASTPEPLGTRIVNFLLGRKTPAAEPKPGDGPVHPLLTGESGDLALEGLRFDGSRLKKDGVKAETLGVGLRGFVDAHPSVEGAVIKTVNMAGSANPMIAAEESTPEALSAKEEKVARELSDLGAGPKFVGKSTIDGRLVSVRERIYGKTIEKLISERAYGPAEHALVLEMLKKLSGAGVYATDMKAENIMIGRTAADGTRRAWLVDGGSLAKLPAGLDAPKALDAVLDAWVPTTSQFGAGTSVRKITEKGLSRFKGLAPPKSEAERLDREFEQAAIWAEIAPAVRAEIEGLRARKLKKDALRAYVQEQAAAALERVKASLGVSNVGFHFNLHGGRREDYVGAGINATMGDIALNYTTQGDTNHKVYFFQSAEHGLFAPLDERNPAIMFFPSRMGFALNLFDLNHPLLEKAKADGRIKNFGGISMDFHGMRGVPYETYLAPPLEVFVSTKKRLGMSVSRDEETLATLRFVEAALARGGAFIPGGSAAPGAEKKAADALALAAAAASPATRIVPQFALVDDAFYYHGTTLDDVARIAASGGLMLPDVSQFSLRARDSVEYAATRRSNLKKADNPEVLLQFEQRALSPYVSGKLFQPALMAMDRGMPPTHAAYMAAEKPVPLSLMTAASKRTLLSWLRSRNDPRLAAVEAALNP